MPITNPARPVRPPERNLREISPERALEPAPFAASLIKTMFHAPNTNPNPNANPPLGGALRSG